MYAVAMLAVLGILSVILNAFVKEELNRLNSRLNKQQENRADEQNTN